MDGLAWVRKQVEQADIDLLREMVKLFCERVMGEEADAMCGAAYGERSEERTNRRNGYRTRGWDTRTGTIDLAIPKLREGSYFPDWLLEPRRRAERAFVQVVTESYVRGVSTRRVEGLVRHLGIERISRSRVSQMAKELDHQVEAFRSRPLDGGPYTYVWLDALTQKVREGGRIANVACVVATGVNATGAREILGLDLHTSEDGGGLDRVPARPGGQGPLRGPPGDLRCPPGPRRRDRLHPSRSHLATVQDPLPPQPADPGSEVGRPVRGHPGPVDLRSA
jgi:putative transposase